MLAVENRWEGIFKDDVDDVLYDSELLSLVDMMLYLFDYEHILQYILSRCG